MPQQKQTTAPKKATPGSMVVMEDVIDRADDTKTKRKRKKDASGDFSIDFGSLCPNGILKLIQTVLNITCISLIATHWHCQVHTIKHILYSPDLKVKLLSFSMLNYTRLNDHDLCKCSGQLALALLLMCLPATVVLFLAFLFSMPEKFGKKDIWMFTDLVNDVIAALFCLISFILASATIVGGTNVGVTSFLASMLFVDMVAYIISAGLAVIAMIGGPGKKRKEPRKKNTPPSGQRQRQNESATSARQLDVPHEDVFTIVIPRVRQSQGQGKGQGRGKERRHQRRRSH